MIVFETLRPNVQEVIIAVCMEGSLWCMARASKLTQLLSRLLSSGVKVPGVDGRLLVSLWRVDVLVSLVCVLVLGLGHPNPCTCFFYFNEMTRRPHA